MSQWNIFSNYGHVLFFLAREPKARLRDIAEKVGITERAVQTIVHDLEQSGYLAIQKRGRRNQYKVNRRKHLRHPLESKLKIGQIVKLLDQSSSKAINQDGQSEPAVPQASVQSKSDEAGTSSRDIQSLQQSLDL